MTKTVQVYLLHLTNGDVVEAAEGISLTGNDTIVSHFLDEANKAPFKVGDAISGLTYIPKSSIVYISTGEVREVVDLNALRKAGII